MANVISALVYQIGIGTPLSTAQTMALPVDKIIAIFPTQNQSGGAPYYDNYINQNPQSANIYQQVYSRIDIQPGIGMTTRSYYSSATVASLITASNA